MYLYYTKDYIRGLMAETLVPFQSIRSTKTLLAQIAFVRFLARVNKLVASQMTKFTLVKKTKKMAVFSKKKQAKKPQKRTRWFSLLCGVI